MPVITLDAASLSEDKKEEIVKELTETAAKHVGLHQDAFHVFIREYPLNGIGVGGQLLGKKK